MDKWTIVDNRTGERIDASLNKVMEHAHKLIGSKSKARNAVTGAQLQGQHSVLTSDGSFTYVCERGKG